MTYYLPCIFVFLAVAFVARAQDDSLFCFDPATCCIGQPNTRALADWSDCNKYYLCFNEEPSAYECPEDRPAYNPETGQCTPSVDGCVDGTRPPLTNPPETTITSTSTTTSTAPPTDGNCTEGGTYFVPYPGDCRKFMICSNGQLLPDYQECAEGTLFDPVYGECNLEHLVDCKPNCPDSGTTTFPHDRNCSLYWLCVNGDPNLRQCPPGLVYDPPLGTCNYEEVVFCPNLCPRNGTVNLPHARNCSLYWLCIFSEATLRQCPPGLLFDPVLGQCYDQDQVECQIPEFDGFVLESQRTPDFVRTSQNDAKDWDWDVSMDSDEVWNELFKVLRH